MYHVSLKVYVFRIKLKLLAVYILVGKKRVIAHVFTPDNIGSELKDQISKRG